MLWVAEAGETDATHCADEEALVVAIQVRGTVQQDGTLVFKLPAGVSPGVHEMVVVLPFDMPSPESAPENAVHAKKLLEFHAYPIGLVDNSLTFRREELYDNQP